jgi:hypothetical protein
MRAITSILGLVAGLVLAILFCEPIYDLIWPKATDKNQGGLAFFGILVLAPAGSATPAGTSGVRLIQEWGLGRDR